MLGAVYAYLHYLLTVNIPDQVFPQSLLDVALRPRDELSQAMRQYGCRASGTEE